MTARRFVLLFLPVTIAFIVGGAAPTLVNKPFNLLSGFIWGAFIFIIDYNFIVIKKMSFVAGALRVILVLFSSILTSLVADHIVFHGDIKKISVTEECPKCFEIQKEIDKQTTIMLDNRKLYEEERLRGGCRSICMEYDRRAKKAEVKIDNLTNERDKLEGETAIMSEIERLYRFIISKNVNMIVFSIFFFTIMIIEILPLVLKNAQTERDMNGDKKSEIMYGPNGAIQASKPTERFNPENDKII